MKKRLFPYMAGDDAEWLDSPDDGDAAFWDEFMRKEVESDEQLDDEGYTMEVVENGTGEIIVYEGVRIKENGVRKLD